MLEVGQFNMPTSPVFPTSEKSPIRKANPFKYFKSLRCWTITWTSTWRIPFWNSRSHPARPTRGGVQGPIHKRARFPTPSLSTPTRHEDMHSFDRNATGVGAQCHFLPEKKWHFSIVGQITRMRSYPKQVALIWPTVCTARCKQCRPFGGCTTADMVDIIPLFFFLRSTVNNW